MGGDCINYPGEVGTLAVDMLVVKCMLNSIVSIRICLDQVLHNHEPQPYTPISSCNKEQEKYLDISYLQSLERFHGHLPTHLTFSFCHTAFVIHHLN